MREFMILIVEIMFIAVLQIFLGTILDEGGTKWAVKVLNISCISISYVLLVNYVYNQFANEISSFMNFYF